MLIAVGAAIRKAREAKGLTQQQLADAVPMTRPYLTELEQGVKNPTLITLKRLAEVLDVTLAELMTEADV